jgi:hypothetical protein
MANPAVAFALAWPKVGGGWPNFVRRLTYGPNQAKIGRKRLTIRHLAHLLDISESGLYKSLLHGGLKVETFKALRELLPVSEKEKRYLTQLYLEHEVGHFLFGFSHTDFIKHYECGIHRLGFPRFDGQGEVDRTGNDDRASKEKKNALQRGI